MAPLQSIPLNVSGVTTIGSVGIEFGISFSKSIIEIGPLFTSASNIDPLPSAEKSSRLIKNKLEPTPVAAPYPPGKTAT